MCFLCAAVQVFGTDYVERGGTIQLVCNASGRPDPPHDIEWFKDNEQIRSDTASGVLIAKKIETRFLVSVLKIFNSRLSDAGQYVCRTSDRESSSVSVHVLSGNYIRFGFTLETGKALVRPVTTYGCESCMGSEEKKMIGWVKYICN